MKQPDRFARVVGQHRLIACVGMGYILLEETARYLLRLEHRRVVRLVKDELAYRVERNRDPNEVTDVSGISACRAILIALARRVR